MQIWYRIFLFFGCSILNEDDFFLISSRDVISFIAVQSRLNIVINLYSGIAWLAQQTNLNKGQYEMSAAGQTFTGRYKCQNSC